MLDNTKKCFFSKVCLTCERQRKYIPSAVRKWFRRVPDQKRLTHERGNMVESRTPPVRPFHETIISAITFAGVGCSMSEDKRGEVMCLVGLLEKTELPQEHLAEVASGLRELANSLELAAAKMSATRNRAEVHALASAMITVADGLLQRANGNPTVCSGM